MRSGRWVSISAVAIASLIALTPGTAAARTSTPAASSPAVFQNLAGIASADGALWVTTLDGPQGAIWRVTTSGQFQPFNNPHISQPREIIKGAGNALWFVNHNSQSIARMTPSGQVTNYWLTVGYAVNITAGPGGIWFTTGIADGVMGKLTWAGEVKLWDSNGGSINSPYGITPGPDGNVWFTNVGTEYIPGSISKITPSGERSPNTPLRARRPNDPYAIASGPDCTFGSITGIRSNGSRHQAKQLSSLTS